MLQVAFGPGRRPTRGAQSTRGCEKVLAPRTTTVVARFDCGGTIPAVRSTLRLGRFFGIEVDANWSLLVIFALIAWTLASSALPAEVGRQPTWAYWLAGVVGAALFYVGLLAHEFSHALVARRHGVQVAGITLWLFGGVSRLAGEPATARDEALITVVGPGTSLLVAAAAYLVSLAFAALGMPALITNLVFTIAYLNLALAVFNLVPAFPLDGGRLLTALLWWRSGSRLVGMRRAVVVGRVLAYLMIAFGLLELLMGSLVGGVWIAFIGWFLLSAASAEEAATVARSVLRRLTVGAVMSAPVVTTPDWLSVGEFLRSLAPNYHFSTYPLHAPDGRLTGVARLPDLLRLKPAMREQRLRECATPIAMIATATTEDDVEALLERVSPQQLQQRILVYHNRQLAGILSPSDVARRIALGVGLPPVGEVDGTTAANDAGRSGTAA